MSKASETVAYGGNADGSTATANEDYYFVNWTDAKGEVVSTEAKYNPTNVTADATYTANFKQKVEITVTAKDLSKTYDGTAIQADDDAVQVTDLPEGYTYEVTTNVSADVINVDATGQHLIDSVKVLDSEGNDVTDQFTVKTQAGTLTINKRNVTLKSACLLYTSRCV